MSRILHSTGCSPECECEYRDAHVLNNIIILNFPFNRRVDDAHIRYTYSPHFIHHQHRCNAWQIFRPSSYVTCAPDRVMANALAPRYVCVCVCVRCWFELVGSYVALVSICFDYSPEKCDSFDATEQCDAKKNMRL